MKSDKKDYEQLLARSPHCFGLPHVCAFSPPTCEPCVARIECHNVCAQLLLAKSAGLLNGKLTTDVLYSKNDEFLIRRYIMLTAEKKTALSPCSMEILPRLYDRAMRAYQSRPEEPSLEQMLAEFESEESDTMVDEMTRAKPNISIPIAAELVQNATVEADATLLVNSGIADVEPAEREVVNRIPVETTAPNIFGANPDVQSTSRPVTLEDSSIAAHSIEVGVRSSDGKGCASEIIQQAVRAITASFLAGNMKGYRTIRDRFIALHFEANMMGRWAPRFRDIPAQLSDDEPGNLQLMQDRQVIDLHWLWATKRGNRCDVELYETLFSTFEFDYQRAVRFAREEWKYDTKAEYLNLTEAQQWELGALQTHAIRKRWATIKAGDRVGAKIRQIGASQVDKVLREGARPQHQRYIQDQVATWVSATITKKRWTAAARLAALITGGAQRDPRQIERSYGSVIDKIRKSKICSLGA